MAKVEGRKQKKEEPKTKSHIDKKREAIDRAVARIFGEKVEIVLDDVGKRTYIITDDFIAQFNSIKEVKSLKKFRDKLKEET